MATDWQVSGVGTLADPRPSRRRSWSVQIEWLSAGTGHLEFPTLLSVPHLLSREIMMNRRHWSIFWRWTAKKFEPHLPETISKLFQQTIGTFLFKNQNDGATLRQAWTDHTFFFSGRFISVWVYLVDVIWHKKSLKKEKISVKIGTATAHFLPKNTLIPLTCHYFVFFAGELIFLASRLSWSGALSWKKSFSNSNCKLLFFTFSSVFTRFSGANQTSNYRH